MFNFLRYGPDWRCSSSMKLWVHPSSTRGRKEGRKERFSKLLIFPQKL
jgi:hypothetical protein